MAGRTIRVGVLGAGAWARGAHIPGWLRDGRAEVVVVADQQRDLAEAAAREFGIGEVATEGLDVIARGDLDVIDICTPSHTHFDLAWAALEAGGHVLLHEPGAPEAATAGAGKPPRRSWRAQDELRSSG